MPRRENKLVRPVVPTTGLTSLLILRKLRRALLLLLVLAALAPLLAVCLVLLRPAPRVLRGIRNGLFHLWSRLSLRILGARVEVEGRPPRAPFFLVSNHLSYIDILALATVVDGYFISKVELRSWPMLGLLSRMVGTIFVNRELRRDVQRVNRVVEETLARGYGIILFPEGTSSQGYEILPFRSSLLAYPAEHGIPVYSASLSYATPPSEPPANLSVCWWGDAPFFAHFLNLLGLSRWEIKMRFLEEVETANDRKELARALQAVAVEELDPVVAPADRALETGY